MARIPGVRYLQSPASMPRMNNAGEAIGRATEQLGQTISGVADIGFKYAGKIRQMKDAEGQSAFLTQMDSKATEFENGLITSQNPAGWTDEWKSNVNSWGQEIDDLDISDSAKANLKLKYNEWSAAKSDRLATTAALKSVESTKGTIANNLNYYSKRNDRMGYDRTVSDAQQTGIFRPDQIDSIKQSGEYLFFQNEIDSMILQNPDEAEKYVKSSAFMDNPGATTELRDQSLEQIRARRREGTNITIDQFNDGLAQGAYKTSEDIDVAFKDRVPPRVLGQMKEDFTRSQSHAFKLRAGTQEFQDQVRGATLSAIADFNIEDDSYSETAVTINGMINELPPGSATREELQRVFNEKRGGMTDVIRTSADQKKKEMLDFYKERGFTPPSQKITLGAALDDGFLKDRGKLTRLGFTEDQAEEIADEGKQTDAVNKFRELFSKRPNKATASPLEWAAAEAIRDSRGRTFEIEYTRPEDKREADRRLGEAQRRLDLWIAEKPDRQFDDEAINKKASEIMSPYGVEKFQKLAIPPLPDFNDTAPLFSPPDFDIDPSLIR